MIQPESKLLLTVEEAAHELSISRTLMYEHVHRGRLRSVKIGRCRRIARRDLDAFVEGLLGESDTPESDFR